MVKRLLSVVPLLLLPTVALAQIPQSQPHGLHTLQQAGFWSGYALDGFYSSAAATWKVPAVVNDGKGPSEYLYVYIGIGGHGDPTLIQIGSGGLAPNSYFAWYELYPAGAVLIPHTIMPGDIVSTSLACVASCSQGTTQTWQLSMLNSTAGWSWSATLPYASSMASAEWIAEAPGAVTYPLPNYGYLSVTNSLANNTAVTLTRDANGIVMNNPYGETSNPSETVDGNEFSTCWGAAGAGLTPCTFVPIDAPPPPTPAPTPAPPPTPAPTPGISVVFSAYPKSVRAGQPSTLTWSSTNATWCGGSGFSAAKLAGSRLVYPQVTTTYVITCGNAAGNQIRASATVKRH
jgi:hypothetical protein